MTSQNIQNNAKLHNGSNYNELLLFDVKTIKTTQNYKRDQITINLHRFDVKTIKNIEVRSQNIQNNAKLQNWSNYNGLHRFVIKTIKNVEIRRKTFKTTQNYESDQIIVHCIDLTSKRKKCLVTSQNIQNNAKLQNWSKYNELLLSDVKTIKTTQNYKRDQITINLHRFDVKTI